MTGTQTYFENDDAGGNRALSLSLKISAGKNGAPLGKAQKTFNRLITQIEDLRGEIAASRDRLDSALRYHAQKLHPLRRQLSALRQRLVLFAYPFLKAPKSSLSARQRETLRALLSTQLDLILQIDGDLADEKLHAIYAEVEGMTLQQARGQDHADMRAFFEEQMEDFGVDIDLSAFSADMTPEEFIKAQADLMEQFKKAGIDERDMKPGDRPDRFGGGKQRKKTKKQLEREAREKALAEARSRSLSSIYKQLARAFHPDLEQDPGRKAQKQALMQELTAAYRANDMHTLLRLELEWLQKQEHDVARLSDEKLAVYNEVLREQVEALHDELAAVEHDPRYEALRPYAEIYGGLANFHGPVEEERLTQKLAALGAIDTNATGVGALKKLKGLLRDFAQEHAEFERQQALSEVFEEMVMNTPRGYGAPRW